MSGMDGKSTDDKKKICRRCLIRYLAEEDRKNLKKYLDVIKPQDRADPTEYERRLSVCRECDLLVEATCQACGCYAEFRTFGKRSRCPKKKW